MMINLQVELLYDLRVDQDVLAYTWKQHCVVCNMLTDFAKRITIAIEAREYTTDIAELHKPRFQPQVCSDVCKYVREVNPLPYER